MKVFLLLLTLKLLAHPLLAKQSLKDQLAAMDIDYQIRAQEDPDFDRFLVKEQEQRALEQAAAIESKEKRVREKQREELLRRDFVQARKKQKEREEREFAEAEKAHFAAAAKEEEREKQLRQSFIAARKARLQAEQQERKELMARMYDKLARMPASLGNSLKRGRIPKSQREKLYQQILESQKNN